MYKRGGTKPRPSEKTRVKRKAETIYGNLKFGSPCLSLAKSTAKEAGRVWYQDAIVKPCPKAAIVSAQPFPSR